MVHNPVAARKTSPQTLLRNQLARFGVANVRLQMKLDQWKDLPRQRREVEGVVAHRAAGGAAASKHAQAGQN